MDGILIALALSFILRTTKLYNGKMTYLNKVKDELIIIMDMEKGTLKFIIDDEDNGESYSDIPIDKPLAPAVFLYYTNDSLEINEI